jgi:ribosomal silencing factor RsfS
MMTPEETAAANLFDEDKVGIEWALKPMRVSKRSWHWLMIGFRMGVVGVLIRQKRQHYQWGMLKLHGMN